MKTFPEEKYQYNGVIAIEGDMYHQFKCIIPGFSDEIVCVKEGRVKMKDGSSRFYNTIKQYNEKLGVKSKQR